MFKAQKPYFFASKSHFLKLLQLSTISESVSLVCLCNPKDLILTKCHINTWTFWLVYQIALKEENLLSYPQASIWELQQSLQQKGGGKHFLISFKGSVLFAPTTPCWGQKLGVAQGRWGVVLHKSAVIPGRVFLFLVFLQVCLSWALYQLPYTNPQSTHWGEGQSLHCLNVGPTNTLSWCVEDDTLLLPQAPQQIIQAWDRSWLFFFSYL